MARPGWRGLGAFWLAALAVTGAGAVALQVVGPPRLPSVPNASEAPVAVTAPVPVPVPVHQGAPGPPIPPHTAPGAIPPPDPALLEPAPNFPASRLPRVSADGRTSIRVYGRGYDAADHRPRLALLVVGLGLDAAASRNAIQALPPAVSLGFSPYSHDVEPLLDEVRASGHEFLVTLAMESQGYPLNNGGPHELITGADPADNVRNLEWMVSRMQGEVGVTGASDGLRGERYAASPGAIGPVLREVARRGLLYVDPRPGAAVSGPATAVTTVIEDGADRAEVDARLAALEQQARNGGPALGLALRPNPVTVERIAAWARGLDGRGIALVPVSAFVKEKP